MRIELTDGNWADVRDKIKGKDKFAVQKAVTFETDQAGTSRISAELMTIMTNTILKQLIQEWSFPSPIPSQAPSTEVEDGASVVLGDLDIEDYNLLEEFAKPFLNKVLQGPNRETPSA